MKVFGHDIECMGRLEVVPISVVDVTGDWQSPRRCKHRQRGCTLGAGSSIRWWCHYWCVCGPEYGLTDDVWDFSAGARMGLTEHTDDNRRVYTLTLTEEDRAAVNGVLERSNGRQLITSIGDCGAEYR